jgi:hypothetical protein
MKIIILCILVFVASISIKAQENVNVLVLKNGSIIKGKILENNTDSIKIQTLGNLLVFSQNEVISNDQKTTYKSGKSYKQKRYFNLTTIGILLGSTVNEKVAPVSVLMEHDFGVYKYLTVGSVFGFEMLNETVCPIAANIKLRIPVHANDLFFGVSGGYSISTEKPDVYGVKKGTGGYMFNAEVGYLVAISGNTGVYFAIGYRYNELNYKMEDWWWDGADRKMFFDRISFRTGISLF